LRSLKVVLCPNVDVLESNTAPSTFLGCVNSANAGERVTSYNFKVANNHVYNQNIVEVTNNNESLMRLKNSVFKTAGDDNMYCSRGDSTDNITFRSLYESTKGNFIMACGFEYSDESSLVSQGISSGGHPVQMNLLMAGAPNLTAHAFAECGYNLEIKNGKVSYVEVNDNYGKSSF